MSYSLLSLKIALPYVFLLNLTACFSPNTSPSTATDPLSVSLSGQPTSYSNSTTLSVTPSGIEVSRYRYKIGVSSSTDCGSSSGYSGSIDKATQITDDISGLSDGELKICIVGEDDSGTLQSYSKASSITWTKDTTPPTVTVATPSPTSGSLVTNFDFSVTITGASSSNVTASDITVNSSGGSSCDAPTVTNATTANPTVRLSNCTGTGTLNIVIKINVASDLAGNQNLASSNSSNITVNNGPCPVNYVEVPANATYGIASSFCVMKYEAKAKRDSDGVIHTWGCDTDTSSSTGDSLCTGVADNWVEAAATNQPHTPESTHEGRPWREIDRDQAIIECRSLNSESGDIAIDADSNGDGTYDLITNDQWQTISRNIEAVTSNWKENVVGGVSAGGGMSSGTDSNEINHGHADDVPTEPLVASSTDTEACINTGQAVNAGTDDSCTGSGAGWDIEKRTHTLSNGSVIWDMAGNVWEWVKDDFTGNYGATAFTSQVTAASHNVSLSLSGGTTTTPRNTKDQFGPFDDYTSLNSGTYGGLGRMYNFSTSGAVVRGGAWFNGTNSSMFFVFLNSVPSSSGNDHGFRCTMVP